MNLCLNCLEQHNDRSTPVGRETGSQRDPVRRELSLCAGCRDALVEGDLALFHEAYSSERTVRR